MNNKLTLFFALVLVSVAFTGKAAWHLAKKTGQDFKLVLGTSTLLVTFILYMVYKKAGVCSSSTESFRFQLTPAKMTLGGPYMWSSAPADKKAYLNKIYDSGASYEYSCGTPVLTGLRYNGPGFTSISNDRWVNGHCATCTAKSFYDPELNANLGNPGVL